MDIVGNRLKSLRESLKLTQKELATKLGITHSAVNRYENNQSEVPNTKLLKYADYFDVSLDYIYGRTDKPQGRPYDFKPEVDDKEMRQFIDMCFDPSSPMSSKLKDAVLQAMKSEANK